jgi:anthranilate phosphoribosyltransferase
MDIQQAIRQVLDRKNLNAGDMREIMRSIMSGGCTVAQIAGFLIALRMKGESVDEITAAAGVMRDLSEKVNVTRDHLLDTCGTGGDGANTFNISTAAALVAAAAGCRVAKHGNRSVSSKSGSADVLEAGGVKLELTPDQVAECINRIGIGFMFAPMHHGAMKHAAAVRKELGVRTLFNLLGPLTNPAGAACQLLGVYAEEWLGMMACVLRNLGSRHVMVAYAYDGMDEISISAPTRVAELVHGKIKEYLITPEQFSLPRGDIRNISTADAKDSLAMMKSVFDNQPGPALDVVLMNAGAAIYTADMADSLQNGIILARTAIEKGAAREKLEQLITLTNSF